VKGSKRRVNSCIAQGSRAKASKYSIIGTSPTSLSMSNFRGPFNPFCTQQSQTDKQSKKKEFDRLSTSFFRVQGSSIFKFYPNTTHVLAAFISLNQTQYIRELYLFFHFRAIYRSCSSCYGQGSFVFFPCLITLYTNKQV
jgi:hypothetical protein